MSGFPIPRREYPVWEAMRGRTLIELLVAIVLSLLVVAAVGILYNLASRSSRTSLEVSSAEERGRLAMYFIGEPIAVAGYGNINSGEFNVSRFQAVSFQGPLLRACTNGRFRDVVNNDFTCVATASPGDQLFLSFQADSVTGAPQGALTDCLGQAAPVVAGVPTVANAFSIEPAASGTLEFGCLGNGGPARDELVRDVEDFKVYFAFDPNSFLQSAGGGSPHTMRPTALMTATQINALPGATDPPESTGNPWNHIVAVYACVQLRTAEAGTTPEGVSRYRPCPRDENEAAVGTAEVALNDGIARRTFTEVFTVRSRAQSRAGSGVN
jgi:hypothetical protein